MTEPTDTYTCSQCRRTFAKSRPDADVVAEYEAEFGVAFDPGDVDILCDECHEEFSQWMTDNELRGPDGKALDPRSLEARRKLVLLDIKAGNPVSDDDLKVALLPEERSREIIQAYKDGRFTGEAGDAIRDLIDHITVMYLAANRLLDKIENAIHDSEPENDADRRAPPH